MSSDIISAAKLRFQRDLANISLPSNIKLNNIFDNAVEFTIEFQDGLYCGIPLDFALCINDSYPFMPPKIRSLSRLFHPNVCPNSHTICLNILRLDWRPTIDVELVILSIFCLFNDDTLIDFDDALNKEAAQLYIQDKARFILKTRQSVINRL